MTRITLLASAGNGPGECQIALHHVLRALRAEAERTDIDHDIAETAGPHGPRSALIVLHGPMAASFAKQWVGPVLWRHTSPLRPNHKRRNWFVQVFDVRLPAPPAVVDPRAVRYQTLRAGGPGGQHQNTTDSAVRATWRDLSVVVRDQRSQHRNKAAALERLSALAALRASAELAQAEAEQHKLHAQLQRGGAQRVL